MALRASGFASFACAAVAVVLACSDSSQFPPIKDQSLDASSFKDGISFADTSTACNAGSSLDVCACTELSFLTDVPNLYFVLDRSGSMAADNKWTTIRLVISQVMKSIGPRANFGAAAFPGGGSNQCAAGTQIMATRPGDSPAGTEGPTTSLLLAVTATAPGGGTPTAATLQGLLPTLKGLSGRTFVILATDGGPNCNGAAACGASTCIDNIEGVSGCTVPTNCCDPNIYGPLDCLDEQPTIDAVTAISNAGISTYVVGVPGSGPYGSLLDQLATAGGTARTSEPLYYAVSTSDEAAFESALGAIAAKITGTCTLQLKSAPPDPSQVNVYFDNVAVLQDPLNGWSLSGETITLLGTSCDQVMSGTVLNVRVVAGCPTLQPN